MEHELEHTEHDMVNGEHSPKEYLKFAFVILFIFVISLLIQNLFGGHGWIEYLRWFMGMFFVVFATFKFIGYEMFVVAFAGYDIVAKKFRYYSYLYPFIELLLGGLYLANMGGVSRDIFTVLIMGVGAVGVSQEIKKRSGIHCACLGNIIKLPLSTVSLVEDVGMGLMAIFVLLLS